MIQGDISTLKRNTTTPSKEANTMPLPVAPDSVQNDIVQRIKSLQGDMTLDVSVWQESTDFLLKSAAYTTEVNQFIIKTLGHSKSLTPQLYKKLASQALDYICHHIQLIIGTNQKITASLMYLNTFKEAAQNSPDFAGTDFKGNKIAGVLEIDAFDNKYSWKTPYIEIPYFKGVHQILGAPTSLATGRAVILNNTLDKNLPVSKALKAYFTSNKSILETFISIPLYSSEEEPLGVLNINANQKNFFDSSDDLVQSVVEPWCKYLIFLLFNRPTQMEKNNSVNHDEYHENYMDYLSQGRPFLEKLKTLGSTSISSVVSSEKEEDNYDEKRELEHAGREFTVLITNEDNGILSAVVRYGEPDERGVVFSYGKDWDELVSMLHDALDIDYPRQNVL